ncbi:MAG: hypothetical protein Fur006_37630 [Coleofasciculaceae cyanobacterium]
MPLQLPNLDDRNYPDLVEEALTLIPTDAPEWTNYNPSDPGITLIELFAYLTEMLLYRLNRVTDENIHSFLKLLNGPNWTPSGREPEALAKDIQTTILKLRKQERAVSCEDFQELAKAADARVARVHCIPRRNLNMDFETEREGHIGLIVVPQKGKENQLSDIISKVRSNLEHRRLLTTRLHVVEPQYLKIQVQATVVPLPDVKENDLVDKVVMPTLEKFFDPIVGGKNGTGWPFGRSVFVSEIYELLDGLPGVDYVTAVDLQRIETNVPNRRIEVKKTDNNIELIGLELKPYELVKAQVIVKTQRRL